MNLPFSEDQFLDVFAQYNSALWPVVAAFWFASAGTAVQLFRRRLSWPMVAGLAATQWGWTAIAYHGVYFSAINQAAIAFAALFLLQAVGFLWAAIALSHTSLQLRWTWRHAAGVASVLYALLYPAIVIVSGLAIPRAPLYAVPCPLTLYTVGVLLIAEPRPPRWLFIVPLVWSMVGGSAAVLLGMIPDVGLIVAGIALAMRVIGPAQSTARPVDPVRAHSTARSTAR